MVQPVPESMNFPAEEDKIMELWAEIDAFKTSLKQSKGRPRYTFYDGPPFATGLPHYGHILAGTIKDIVTRWAHQTGYHVDRRFGWDCHGLPVEYEIDKSLDIKGPEDVARMGIEAYNNECRKIVMRYSKEWKEHISRMGRWIDFDNDYKTMYPSFMETIWFVFKELYTKGLVYQGVKVMPYSTACNTPLSNFESGQNYKDVTDPAVIISFPLVTDPNIAFIAWTTTPWTLPSNLAICVNPDMDYVKVRDTKTDKVYIMMEARLPALFKTEEEYCVVDRFKGNTLENIQYKPLFPYFENLGRDRGAFRVLTGAYVTAESGTGIVHQAPYFGEDDFRVCLANGIISKDMKPVCPVDASGRFTEEVTDFKGLHVKVADKEIIKWLKNKDRLVHQGTTVHSYPFCWRSETPLIYKAVPSWFVRVEQATTQLLENNQKTYWVPDFVKEKRFANWLRDARDWAISRNRYWGTPIPMWMSEDGEEVVCIGSIQELEDLSGIKVTDLHRDTVDKITIPSALGKGPLRRIPEVFDCWFESGSMPYAQVHYPFENKRQFEDSFPADFIAEGIDQTRGWFYTLLVLSTLLFGKPPFKNLICHGLILAEDGSKMSKRKKNYPDPMEIVHAYGADALRLYLINSPVVRAENLRFKQEGVRDVLKDVFLPWFNAYRLFMQSAGDFEKSNGVKFLYNESTVGPPENFMDRWILSFTQSLIKFVKEEMTAYRLHTVVPRLVKFVDQLTNWYVRMNRKRIKGNTGVEDCQKCLESFYSVLFSMSKVMAPFIPFLTEHMYQNLRHLADSAGAKEEELRSIHFLPIPNARDHLIDSKIELAVSRMQSVIELGRYVRDKNTLPLKYPLKEVVAIPQDVEAVSDIKSLEYFILEELNVKTLTVTTDREKYGVHLEAQPDRKVLGIRMKDKFKNLIQPIQDLTHEDLLKYQQTGEIFVCDEKLVEGDIRLKYKLGDSLTTSYDAQSDGQVLLLLDVKPDQSLLDEGVAREVINRIQKLRKEARLVPADEITVFYKSSETMAALIQKFYDFIFATIKQPLVLYPVPSDRSVIIQECVKFKKDVLDLTIVRGHPGATASNPRATVVKLAPAPVKDGITPVCKYVNAVLCGISPRECLKGGQATILLENPIGDHPLTHDRLVQQVQAVFGLRGCKVMVYLDSNLTQQLSASQSLTSLHKKTLYVTSEKHGEKTTPAEHASSVCHFVNLELVGAKNQKATLLLENPRSNKFSWDQLSAQVSCVFDADGKKITFSRSSDGKDIIDPHNTADTLSLHTSTLYVLLR